MKYLTLFFFLFTASIYGQIAYEQGYIVDSENNKISCYIRNSDWSSSPDKIYYKLNLESETQVGAITTIKEFYIFDTEHYYKRFNVSIDRNAFSVQDSNVRELTYIDRTVFLKVLVEGKGNLYEYGSSNIFLYNIDNSPIKQLEYKKYITESLIKKENNDFQKELYDNLKCESFTTKKLVKINYRRKQLIKLFSEYNECQEADYKTYQLNKKPLVFNLNVSMGFGVSTLESEYNLNGIDGTSKFDSQIGIIPGFDFELVLPYNKNKWAIFIGANYQSYKKSAQDLELSNTNLGTLSFEYSYVETPIGIKHYMYLNKDLKLFLSASYAPILNLSSKNDDPFEKGDNIQGNVSFDREKRISRASVLGFGCKFRNKYSIGLNYYISKSINNSTGFSNNMDGSIALIASYKVF